MSNFTIRYSSHLMNSFIDHGKFSYFLHKKYVAASQSKTHLRCAAIAIITFPTSNNQIPQKVDFKNVLKNQDTKIFNTSSIYMDNMYIVQATWWQEMHFCCLDIYKKSLHVNFENMKVMMATKHKVCEQF